jgi:hypothetical protein
MVPLGGGMNHSSIGAPLQTGGDVTGMIEILYPPAPALNPAEDSDANGLPDAWNGFKVEELTDEDSGKI